MSKNGDKTGKRKTRKNRKFWVLKIFVITFVLAYFFGIISEIFVREFDNLLLALLTIFIIILIGVVFDIIGTAVTAASEVPFLSMASKRIRGAIQAVYLVKNADVVSNFCNDVVGDICGILSGAAGGVLVARIASGDWCLNESFLSIIVSGLIAALTVGGKAVGKSFAINNNQKIVYYVGYLLSFFVKEMFVKKKKKRPNRIEEPEQ